MFYKKKNLFIIIHVTNFNERLDGRLFFNTGRRINNGFIRGGHSVLGLTSALSALSPKSFTDFSDACS